MNEVRIMIYLKYFAGNILHYFITISLTAIFSCCSPGDHDEEAPKEEVVEKQAELTDVRNSGCNDTRSGDESAVETIVLKRDGSIITCGLLNYDANCGLEKFDVSMTLVKAKEGPDSVFIDVEPMVPHTMDCTCPYSVSFVLRDLALDDFYLRCWWFEGNVTLRDKDSLTIENTMEETEIDGLKYLLKNATLQAVVKKGNTWEGDLRIPSEVIYEGKSYIVTGMYYDAFSSCTTLTKVIFPKTLKQLDYGAYNSFNKNPFFGCTALTTIDVEEGNSALCSIDGVLFSSDRKQLYAYPAGALRTSYSVPEGVVSTYANVFAFAQNLKVVHFPSTVEEMFYGAFRACPSLESVTLSDRLSVIEMWTFSNCASLTDVTVPASVKQIGQEAFSGCTSLHSLDLSASVTNIGGFAFSGCTMESLYVRGSLDDESFERNIFGGMATTATLYVPAADLDRFKSLYHGVIFSL